VCSGPREDLDVETQGALTLADELGQRQAGELAQILDDAAQGVEPLQTRLRHPLPVRAPPRRRRQVVERLDDAGPVGTLRRLVANLADTRMPQHARLVTAPRGRVELPRLVEVLVRCRLEPRQLEDLCLAG
jgi:hypothetical protein